MLRIKKPGHRFWCRDKGGVTVEFALVIMVFLAIVAGIIDFGHAYYMQQVITTASREGARYGSRYQTNDSGLRIVPNSLSPSIGNWITTQYQSLLPGDAYLNTTVGGAGATSGIAGDDLSITVNANKNWFIVHNFVPGMTASKMLTATTVMKCE